MTAPVNPDELIEVNGVPTKIRDLPPIERAMFGYGHFPLGPGEQWRKVQPGEWEYTPETCLLATVEGTSTWSSDGKILVCDGCGLDCT